MEEFSNTVVAILLTVCNKYEPGQQVFRLQSLVGLKENTNMVDKVSLSKANLLNADPSNVPIGSINTASVLRLEVPFEVSRRYPLKYIPPGTRFLVSFSSGDITKPIIVGGEF